MVMNARVELVNTKEAMRALEERVSADRSLIISTLGDCNHSQIQLSRTLAKLHFCVGALTAAFDQPKKSSVSVQMCKPAMSYEMFYICECLTTNTQAGLGRIRRSSFQRYLLPQYANVSSA